MRDLILRAVELTSMRHFVIVRRTLPKLRSFVEDDPFMLKRHHAPLIDEGGS